MIQNLPSGLVTFLFTDIEGSTRLWENHPEAMRIALERHNILVKEAIESNEGIVFKTVGDSFCSVFKKGINGLQAALVIQRALNSEIWPDKIRAIRVRIGIHSGDANAQEGDYFGPPLNLTARIEAAGHGGQILISLATQEVVRDVLPNGITLIELGSCRLKDISSPVMIFQVSSPDLPSDFPAIKTFDLQTINLPSMATQFIGRKREVSALIKLLKQDNVRLVTLTGPGGIGKTRLSIEVAQKLYHDFDDGIFFVELAPITDSDFILAAIAGTFGISESGDESLLETLLQFLQKKQILIVIDNFEHVIDGADVISSLISGVPKLKILTSSRELLYLYGEFEYPVPPLGLPDGTSQQSVAVVSQYESVSLFFQSAIAAKADFEITANNCETITEICKRLEGLPLAIELAAARVRMFEPKSLLTRLSDSLMTLVGGARNLPERQQTIRGAIEWSYDLLDGEERILFARLGVFQGGCGLEMAEAVCALNLKIDVIDGIESLYNKNLLRREIDSEGNPNFFMLETILSFARSCLEKSSEAEVLRKRHAEYFLAMAEEANENLSGYEQNIWRNRLTLEYENFRKALDWYFKGEDISSGVLLISFLGRYWHITSRLKEGWGWLSRGLEFIDQVSLESQGRLYLWAGYVAWGLHDFDKSKVLYEKALSSFQEIGDKSSISHALICLGLQSKEPSELNLASSIEGLALAREIGDKYQIGFGLNILGEIYRLQDNYPAAKNVYEEALLITREVGLTNREIMILCCLGLVAFNQGFFDKARNYTLEMFNLSLKVGSEYSIANSISFLGAYICVLGEPELGISLMAVGTIKFSVMGSRRQFTDQFEFEKLINLAHKSVGDESFDRFWAEGELLLLDDAIELIQTEYSSSI